MESGQRSHSEQDAKIDYERNRADERVSAELASRFRESGAHVRHRRPADSE
jgi:hypothetical protein